MGNNFNSAVYFFHQNNHLTNRISINYILNSLKQNQLVSIVWDSETNPLVETGPFVSEIIEKNINRIILTGDNPGFIKSFFAKVMNLSGKDPDKIFITNLREYDAIKKSDTEKALKIINYALEGETIDEQITTEITSINPDTLVIGGGIAGIQASLEIADSRNKVYLVEKSGTIGGHMAMFDKTFPTLDCAACILTPKMVEVGQHHYIELITYSEVESVSGMPGNYLVKIRKKARRVDIKTCIGCGTCAEKCPGSAPSEFDAGTTRRKAIYMPFPQAVPNKYLIDADSCTYVQKGKCGVCVKVCPVDNCINLNETDQVVEINVGNIIVATGFKTFDPAVIDQFGYGKFPNVVTSLEFERLVNASGPTEGNIRLRSQDKKGNWIFKKESAEPKSVALIHCVGSRDENHNKYCSRVCCMYSLKLAHLVKEKIPHAEVFEFFIDMRAYGKGYEEFYERIREEGVHLIRGKTARIEEHDSKLSLRTEDVLNNKILEQHVDMVILAVGLEPGHDAGKISKILGIQRTDDGWFKERNSLTDTVQAGNGGITVSGACQGPKDIPDTVAQGSAAASTVLQRIVSNKLKHRSEILSNHDV